MDTDQTQRNTIDSVSGQHALKSLLNNVCGNDKSKFQEACRLVDLFIKQGQSDLLRSMLLVGHASIDEDGEPAMLFFDEKEASLYCEPEEMPIKLYRLPTPN